MELVGNIPGKHEQVVAEPVQITKDERIDEYFFIPEPDAGPFRASADAAADVSS